MSNAIYRTKKEIRALFKQLDVKYLPRARVDWEPLLSMDLTESPYYQTNKEIFTTLADRYGSAIEAGALAPIYIKKIDDTIGFGVFADRPIKKYDFVGEYAGVVQISGKYTHCYNADNGYESDYSWYYVDELAQSPSLEINGRFEGNEMRMVNHSTAPNLMVEHTLYQGQWVLFFVAASDIAQDEQLLISYGDDYWEEGWRTKKQI